MDQPDITQIDDAYRASFLDGYMECALWASLDWDNKDDSDNPAPMDDTYSVSDIGDACRAKMKADCDSFIAGNLGDLATILEFNDASQHGHDFWLTRERHGAGFWDRGYVKDLGDRLTKASQAYGEVNLWGDENGVHQD